MDANQNYSGSQASSAAAQAAGTLTPETQATESRLRPEERESQEHEYNALRVTLEDLARRGDIDGHFSMQDQLFMDASW